MASLEDLLTGSLSGIIQGGGLPLEEDLYQRQAQAERESSFGRGLGISSVTRDALAKARTDAALAAQSAQLSALGQAAGITQQNANRAQQASQFGASMSQRNRELGMQESMANKQMLMSGIGAGVGALGNIGGAIFGPEIRTGTRGLFGLGPLRQDAGGVGGVPAGGMPGGVPGAMPSFDLGAGGGFDLAGLGNFSTPMADFSSYGSGGGGADYDFGNFDFDLSGLFDYGGGYAPYEWGSYL